MTEGTGEGGKFGEECIVSSLQRFVSKVISAAASVEQALLKGNATLGLAVPESLLQCNEGIQRGDQLHPGAMAEVFPLSKFHEEIVAILGVNGLNEPGRAGNVLPEERTVYIQFRFLCLFQHESLAVCGDLPHFVFRAVLFPKEGDCGDRGGQLQPGEQAGQFCISHSLPPFSSPPCRTCTMG